MRIAFIEIAGLTNDLLRAVAGAHPLCVGYPDGVPESWADVSAAQQVREEPRGQFTTPPRYDAEYWAALAVMDADYGIDPAEYGADPAALLGPVAEPVGWRPTTYADLQPGDLAQFAGDLFRAHIASRGDWPDERGDDEC